VRGSERVDCSWGGWDGREASAMMSFSAEVGVRLNCGALRGNVVPEGRSSMRSDRAVRRVGRMTDSCRRPQTVQNRDPHAIR
jgi:hypothetical protein